MPRAIEYRRNPAKHCRAAIKYRQENLDKVKRREAQYREDNREKLRAAAREYFNNPARKAYQRAYVKERYAKDPTYRERLKAYNRKSRIRHREEVIQFLQKLKSSTPCTDCGRYFNPECMDFDHLPEHKKSKDIAQLSSGWTSLARIKQEIAKCELVCACCHRTRTKLRRQTTEKPHHD